mmetsp:Transcript_12072/g.24564  ORF Transcript_12072/g.24564 Transcript_12072/m.24564 type:complete len:498 (+) Transcript_12072:86-1579(+)
MGLGVSFSVDVTGALVVAGAAVSGIASAVVPVVAVGVAVGVDVAADNGNGNGNGNDNTDGSVIVVTPMTIAYDYELYDGQTIYTNSRAELIPNLDFDYAVLGISAARNINRETNEPVSLDEVYVHHVSFLPLNMIGAEVLTRDKSMPYMKFPDGYALHVVVKESPHIKTNAHLLSNKNLAPIGGSLSRAHKECNECFYAPGKGSDCTPEVSGTFKCCGDNYACTIGREECACATTKSTSTTHDKRDNNTPRTRTRTRTTTKYRIEMDLLISREIGKFKRVDQWNFAAPACAVNLNGDGVFEKYQPDNFCANKTSLAFGGGSLFQNVPENNANPYLKTKVNLLARSGGKLVWAQSHLHTGAINGTLLLNGRVVCTATTTHGTDSDETTNARNEQNHLVRIDSCYDEIGEDGIRFEEGDVFTAESFYYGGRDDERMSGIEAAGEHKNVMSMFFTGVDLDGDSEFLTEKRTSFNLWNNFVPVAGYLKRKRVASSKIHYNS